MIVRTRGGQDRELRDAWQGEYMGGAIPPPSRYGGLPTSSGEHITPERAAGLPAVFNAIRLIAETVGSMPLRVYRGHDAQKRTQEKTWQWDRLHDHVNDDQSPFDFWQDVAASVETWGDAFVGKVKVTKGAVDAMFLIDPSRVTVGRAGGQKVFWLWNDGERLELTTSDVLHVRGPTLRGGDTGLSPLQVCRENIGTSMARASYEGHFYRNNAAPTGAIKLAEKPDRERAKQILQIWMSTHSGPGNAGIPAVLSGGAEWQNLGIPLKDAEFVNSSNFSVADVARMFHVPASLLSQTGEKTMILATTEEARRFLNFSLRPRLKRISEAVRSDPDFFGSGELYPEFFTDELISADAATQAQVRHFYVQDGVLLPDEVRADLGRPPLPNGAGQIPQITPVGGAPNVPAAANPPGGEPT